ncbi:hypothetical protein QWA68_016581, partial [Fusarium oxysporum]
MAALSAFRESEHVPSDASGYPFLYQGEGGGNDYGQRTPLPPGVPIYDTPAVAHVRVNHPECPGISRPRRSYGPTLLPP